eukprot:GEZU01004435.1.p1 GENE.GEZU01004435.1~~GEZU01004435.1.p1  ORF type:complete len:992 (-),score=264.33 GEZU01004435.1:172-3147(-)
MGKKLDVKKKLLLRSDRVKSVDIHPTEPWVLLSLYSGRVQIVNYATKSVVKSFDVSELPVRTAKFIARKQWFIAGADDMRLSVYNYNTMEKIKVWDAHIDYIRSLAVHPSAPYVLSSSDDMSIKLWNWEKNWQNTMIFEGHSHYVMQVVFNPKDPHTFASASLDKTIKVWGLNSISPHFTLDGHEKGVNCVDFYHGNDKTFLISGSDDRTARVWDYQSKACVKVLEGHTHNVSVCCFHPELPVIITGSEDGSIRVWNSNTYRLEHTLNYNLERVWALGYAKGTNKIAFGFDEGTVIIKLGSEEPVVSMDVNGKIIWSVNNEIQQLNIKSAADDVVDGEKIVVPAKELGTCEIFPQYLKHDPKGRFVAVVGDGEYIIYTAIQWRNKSFGKGLELAWGIESGTYAIRESTSQVKVFKNFKEVNSFKPAFSAEAIFGGHLLAIASKDSIVFYDWNNCKPIRKIDVAAKAVYWSDSAELVAICCENSFYVLKFNVELVNSVLETAANQIPEDGIADAFELENEIGEKVREGQWVGDCFVYSNRANRVNYQIGGEVFTLAHLDKTHYFLGFVASTNRVYLIDKERNITSYALNLALLNYETAIVREDFAAAEKILPSIPKEYHNQLARFLDAQGLKDLALNISSDMDHKFELALEIGNLDVAYDIIKTTDAEYKWKELGDKALAQCNFKLAEECLIHGQDFNGLLLLFTSTGDAEGIQRLADLARQHNKNNVAFMCLFLLGQVEKCIDLLCETGRIPEAAFLARTYAPSQISRIVGMWREDLAKVNKRAAESLADPTEYPNLFPDLIEAYKAEEYSKKKNGKLKPASAYPQYADSISWNLIEEMRKLEENGADVQDQEEEEDFAATIYASDPTKVEWPSESSVSPTAGNGSIDSKFSGLRINVGGGAGVAAGSPTSSTAATISSEEVKRGSVPTTPTSPASNLSNRSSGSPVPKSPSSLSAKGSGATASSTTPKSARSSTPVDYDSNEVQQEDTDE